MKISYLVIAVLLVTLSGVVCFASVSSNGKLLLVVLDQVTWHDLQDENNDIPMIRKMIEEGAVGLMCVRAGRGYGGEYATLGAGARAGAGFDAEMRVSVEALAYQANESVEGRVARELHTARTGWPTGENRIVHVGIGRLIRDNFDLSYPLEIGLLGGTLGRAGIRIGCLGNADTANSKRRELVAIAMNEQGLVSEGLIEGNLLRREPALPWGITSNSAAFLTEFERLRRRADFIVLDIGETSRAASVSGEIPPLAAERARHLALARTDQLLSEIIGGLDDSWSVLIITPKTRVPDFEEDFTNLAPVIWWPQANPGVLYSNSTRRMGLVVNTDVAPTVIDYFGLPRHEKMVGYPISSRSVGESPSEWISRVATRHDITENVRRRVFRALPFIAAIAFWSAAFLLLIGERAPGVACALLRALLLVLMAAPPALLLVTLRPMPANHMGVAIIGITIVLALLSSFITSGKSGYAPLSLLMLALLIYDLARGQQMLLWSPLSYSPAAGARFYGIGNELAGALLGATPLVIASLLSPRGRAGFSERVVIGLGAIALAAFIALPRFGANMGMSIAFAASATVFLLYMFSSSPGYREIITTSLAVIIFIAAAMALDFTFRGYEASHIGRWIAEFRRDGWEAFVQVATRKLSMNWMLVRVSLWTDAVVAAMATFVVAVAARPARVLVVMRERSWLFPALVSGIIGTVVAFAFNDSGIVAAGLASMYLAGALAYASIGAGEII